jgi:hypothetical protein
MRRVLAGVVGLLAVLLIATPASARGQDAPIATDVRVLVTSIEPAGAGIEARAVEAGARLELTNHSARTVEVLGIAGPSWVRPAVAAVIALGVGVTVTVARRWHASRPTAPTSSGTEAATTTGPS